MSDSRRCLHPLSLRAKPIVALVVAVVLAPFPVKFISHAVRRIALGVSADEFFFLLSVSIVGIAAELWLVTEARKYWFLLHEYELADEVLIEKDRLFGRTQQLTLRNIEKVHSYRTSGALDKQHVLIGTDGTRIRLTEALPIWPRIAELLPKESELRGHGQHT